MTETTATAARMIPATPAARKPTYGPLRHRAYTHTMSGALDYIGENRTRIEYLLDSRHECSADRDLSDCQHDDWTRLDLYRFALAAGRRHAEEMVKFRAAYAALLEAGYPLIAGDLLTEALLRSDRNRIGKRGH